MANLVVSEFHHILRNTWFISSRDGLACDWGQHLARWRDLVLEEWCLLIMNISGKNTYIYIYCYQTWNLSKKFTLPNFQVKEFYSLKTRKSRLFSPAMNSENASLSVIWPNFGWNWTKCANSLTVMKKVYIKVCVNLQNM